MCMFIIIIFETAVNRLDRLTSGIVLLAKNGTAAAKYKKMIADGKMSKIYLARVKGKFPAPPEGK